MEHLLNKGNLEMLAKMINDKAITNAFLNFNLLSSSLNVCEIFLNKFKLGNEDKSTLSLYLQSQDDKGNTPLHYAVESQDRAKVEYILQMAKELQIELSASNFADKTPLDLAKDMHNNGIIKLLNPDIELNDHLEQKSSSTHFMLTELSANTQDSTLLYLNDNDDAAITFNIETADEPPTLQIDNDDVTPALQIETGEQEPFTTDLDEHDSNAQNHKKFSKH